MKMTKKILTCLALMTGIIIFSQSNVKAANAKISVSNSNPKPGEKVTVTGSVTAGAWNLNLSGNGKSETIYGYTNTNGNSSGSKSITFTAGNPGEKYSFSLTGGMTDINSDSEENVSKNVSIVVAKNTSTNTNNTQANTNNTQTTKNTSNSNKTTQTSTTKDNNTNKEPSFQTTNKVATVTDKVNFRSSYSTSSSSLGKIKEGENVTIIGTGNNGWSKVEYNGKTGYIKTEYLSISEEGTENEETEEQSIFGLELLKVKNLELTPEFSTDIYEYTINATEQIKELDIEQVVANSQTAKVEITGNENFVIGENVVKISVTDETAEKSAVYQITVTIPETTENQEKIDSTVFNEEMVRIQRDLNIRKWIVRGIIIFVTIVIIIMFILRYKTIKAEEGEKEYSKRDGYVIIDDKFDSLEKDKEKIAKIEQFDEELENNKEKDLEPPVQPKRMKKTKGKHF